MRNISLIVSLILSLNLTAQFKISDIYIGVGYLDSRLKEINDLFNRYPDGSALHFNQINGFADFNFGMITSFQNYSKFSIDFSMDYLYTPAKANDITIFKEYSGVFIDVRPIENTFIYGDTALYNCRYQLKTFVFGITPNYKLLSIDWFSIDLGLGLIYYQTILKQEGFDFYASPTLIRTNESSMTSSKGIISWHCDINFGFQLIDHFFIDTQVKYKFGKIKDIANGYIPWNDYIIRYEEVEIYPITQTNIDYRGFNYLLRIRYKF